MVRSHAGTTPHAERRRPGTPRPSRQPATGPSASRRTMVEMMNRTHRAVGAATTLALCAAVHTGGVVAVAAACASVLGSRLPDVDQPGARIHRRTRLERRSLTAGIAGRALRLPMTIFAALATHRGATHWLPQRARRRRLCLPALHAHMAAAHSAHLHRRRLRLRHAPARRRVHTARRTTARPHQRPPRPSAPTADASGDRRRRRPARTHRGHAHRRRTGTAVLQAT